MLKMLNLLGRFPALLMPLFGLLVGCASQMLSDDRIRSNTAGVLGVALDEVNISNRRDETMSTYYIATTKAGVQYACVISGGNFTTMGLITPPSCNRK